MTLDSTGLSVLRLADIRQAMRTAIVGTAALGPSVQTGSDTVIGQIIDVVAQQLADAWGTLQAAYDAMRPDAAEGDALDSICAYAGVIRRAALHSRVTLTATGTDGTVVPIASVFRIPAGQRWVSTAAVTLGSLAPGTAAIPCRSEDTGPVVAAAAAISGIVTVISGLSGVTNTVAAVPGRAVETDSQLRIRRDLSLQRASSSTDQSLRARLLEVDAVQAAVVLSNRTSTTDANGIPAHSFRPIVWPDLVNNPAIWEAIWSLIPMGIASDGTYAGSVTDSQGQAQTTKYSPATARAVHVVVRIVIDAALYPGDGDAQVRAAVLAYGVALSIGDDARPFRIGGLIEGIPGILDLQVRAKIGSTPAAADTITIPIAITQIATIATGDVSITQVGAI